MRRTDRVLGSLNGEYPGTFRHYADAIALFDRCVGLYRAIVHLLAGDFVHEAAVLTRPLIADSLFLDLLAASDERRRAELLIGWELGTLSDWEGLEREAIARGKSDGSALGVFAERRRWLQRYAEATGLFAAGELPRNVKPDGDIKRMADDLGRGDEYLDFRTQHHFTHGSTLAAHARYARGIVEGQDFGRVEIGGSAVDTAPYRVSTGLLAVRGVLHAARATTRLLSAQEPPEVAELLSDIDVLAEAENKRNSASSAASG
jgi:hypothetical protein